jgi:uncharacterized protein YndB with AHSA1/START domain
MAMKREHSEVPTVPGVVELSIEVAAAPAEVWQALTDPARNERWMGGFRMESSWRPGAPFMISGRLNGHDYRETGTIVAAEPPTLLRYDHWSRLWRVPDRPENRAVMTIRIDPDSEHSCVIFLKHELPAVEAIVPHSRFFWTVALAQLQKLLAAERG